MYLVNTLICEQGENSCRAVMDTYRQGGEHLLKVVLVQIGSITQKFTGFLNSDL